MKITKARLKQIIKEELENVLEGVEKAWCVGFEKGGETEHETVYADAGGIAERKIKKKHDIGDKAIKSTKEGKCKRSVNEARSPRSALAFANQVHETLNSAKPPYSFSGSVKRAGTYDTMRTGYGKFLRKGYFDDGDKPDISTLLYDLRVFPKKKEYLPEPWSSSDLDTSEATLEAVKEILQDAYGPIKKMNMRGRRQGVDAIPVGKYAIVFGMRDTILGISKIL